MDWEECLDEKVQKRTPNPEQANSLLRMAKMRIEDNKRRELTEENIPLIVESYWEVIKQLTTALLKQEGYKSYSQECLIVYLRKFQDLTEKELELADQLRRLRNDIDYRGEFLEEEYLDRNEDQIEEIIEKLERAVEERLN